MRPRGKRTPVSGVLPSETHVVGCSVRGERHVSVLRVGGDEDRRNRRVEPQLPEVRVIGHDGQRLTREQERLGIVTLIREALNLWRGNRAGPASAGCARAPLPPAGSDRENHHQRRHHHRRAADEREQSRRRRQVPCLVDSVEGRHDIGGCREPVAGRFRQAPVQDVRQLRRDFRIHVRERRGLVRQHGVQGPERAVCLERTGAGEHFVEQGAEREDVRASIDGLAAHLLRRHVAGGAGDERPPGLGGTFLRR